MTARLVTAAAVLVSAYVHLRLWIDYHDAHQVVGVAWMVNAVAGVVIAVLLVRWKNWLAPLLAVGFGLSTLGAFLIATSSSGLFGVHEKWQGPLVWAATVSELVAIAAGLYAVMAERRAQPAAAAHSS
jgi:hypothetical protein